MGLVWADLVLNISHLRRYLIRLPPATSGPAVIGGGYLNYGVAIDPTFINIGGLERT